MTREVAVRGGSDAASCAPGCRCAAVMQQLLEGVRAMHGDASARLPEGEPERGVAGELAVAINELAASRQRLAEQRAPLEGGSTSEPLESFAAEVARVAREMGVEGRLGGQLGGQAEAPALGGRWRLIADSINSMAANVTAQARHIAEVTRAVARGDLSKKVDVEARGEILELKETINTMIDRLNAFASEVLRVAREVGTEGKLDGQAEVPGVAGIWKEMTDGVNAMIVDLRSSTERNLAQQRELQQANAQLALTSRYKSEFLANMSHELRTPLGSILMLGQQLADNVPGNLTARQLELVRAICGAGADLLRLISDILDLSKIESGTVTVEEEDLLFERLLEALGRSFRYEAERRGLGFEVSLDPALGRGLVTDAKRLQQVLTNLLSNAFKFTAAGQVRLSVFRTGERIAFEVRDTGIGIAPEKQRLVFEAFQQADAGTSRKYGGTGLGLAISRDLAALLGGELQLRSALGEGSTFTLLLPLVALAPPASGEGARPPPPALRDAAPRGSLGALRGREVLVVDDDVRNLFALGSALERHGARVLAAQSGREALTLLEAHADVAVVLMDIMMPELDGYQTIGLIRELPARRALPVIALTAKAMAGDRERCLEAGASAYLAKPVDTDLLLETLQAHLA